MKQGNLATTSEYDSELNQILETKESLDPLSHITKFSLVKGDVTTTISDYLETNPHTIIALAYFDFDLFSPTKLVLEKILPRITKGSVLVFDELNDPDSPGETLALIDSLGIMNMRLKKPRYASRVSYCVWGE
jgi:hypothetical protein